jgi:hypothetical protein
MKYGVGARRRAGHLGLARGIILAMNEIGYLTNQRETCFQNSTPIQAVQSLPESGERPKSSTLWEHSHALEKMSGTHGYAVWILLRIDPESSQLEICSDFQGQRTRHRKESKR